MMDTSERIQICLFIKKLLLLTPVGILVSFLIALIVYSGEAVDVRQVARLQTNNARCVILGIAYRNTDKYYKAAATLYRNPDVLELGSSRVLGFRSRFFKESANCYNAGGAVYQIQDYREFINYILEAHVKPKMIILGLDQYFFNVNYLSSEGDDGGESYGHIANGLKYFQTVIGKEIEDYLKGKYQISQIFRKSEIRKIGFNAIFGDTGFINDGSYWYGRVIHDPAQGHDYQFRDTLLRIQMGDRRFQYGEKVEEKSVSEVNKLLKLCKDQNIHVIGFLPPFAHSIYEKMKSMDDKYAYLFALHKRLQPVFLNYGFKLYDFSDLAGLGASDDEVIDGFHGSEKAYLRLFISLIEKEPRLRLYTDISYLRRRLDASTNPYFVFSNTEF